MKSPYVRELQENSTPSISLLVQSKEIRQKKTGEPYLSLILSDKTGDIESKMWDNVTEVLNIFERDDFVRVKGLVQIYHNRVQLIIHRLRPLTDSEVDFTDFFPASQYDPAVMWEELRGHVNSVSNPHIRGLLNAILDDPEIAGRFRIAPAAKQIHHAFLSGLLEHVISLCRLSKAIAPLYAFIDCDLLIAGCVLHDIGKIWELSFDRGFAYTAEGQLLGHMMIGLRIVADKIGGFPDFPAPLRTLLEHIIISHHGQLDFGSPKVPQFPEALLFHYLDDLDSKMECSRALLERDQTPGNFTSFSHSLDRVMLRKAAYLQPPQARATIVPEPAPAAPKPAPAQPVLANPAPAPPKPAPAQPAPANPAPAAPKSAPAQPVPANPAPAPLKPAPAQPVLANPAPAAPKSAPAQPVPANPAPAPPKPAPAQPASVPHPAPPPPSKTDSIFGAKLLEALRPEK
jgi:3'-5' exoribonuclease